MASPQSISYIYHVAQRLKTVSDAFAPECQVELCFSIKQAEKNLWVMSDLAQLLIRERFSTWPLESYQDIDVKLDRTLFSAHADREVGDGMWSYRVIFPPPQIVVNPPPHSLNSYSTWRERASQSGTLCLSHLWRFLFIRRHTVSNSFLTPIMWLWAWIHWKVAERTFLPTEFLLARKKIANNIIHQHKTVLFHAICQLIISHRILWVGVWRGRRVWRRGRLTTMTTSMNAKRTRRCERVGNESLPAPVTVQITNAFWIPSSLYPPRKCQPLQSIQPTALKPIISH